MFEFFSRLFDASDFVPRWLDGGWTTGLVWLHTISNLAICAACVAMGVVLVRFARRRRDLPFPGIVWLFAALTLLWGTSHLIDAVTIRTPAYRLDGLIKLITALVSLATIVALIPVARKALEFRLPTELEGEVAAQTAELAAANNELRQRGELLRLALGAGRMAVWDHDLVTGRLMWSGESAAVFGIPPAEFGGSFGAFLALIHPDDRGRVEAVVSAAVAAGLDHESEFRVVWPGGTVRWVAARGRVLKDSAGRPMRVVGVGVDISRRRADEEALRDSERQAHEARRQVVRVLEGMADSYMAIDRDWRVTYVNVAAERDTRPRDELLGRYYLDLFPDVAGTEFELQYRRVQKEGVAVDFEAYYPPADGWWEVRAQPGEGGGVSIFYRDVTARKRAEAELQSRAAALAEADRRKDEFLAMLAHELRNPLAPIRNAVQIMQLVELDDQQLRFARDVIRRQVAQMSRLVDDLLDVSRITRGKIALKKEPADLIAIVQRAVETSRPIVDARRHSLTVDVPPGPLSVEGDVTRLAQVLSNLLNNAAKYTEEGGRISLTVTGADGEAVIRVRDSGVGMPSDLLPNVFDLFTQAERTLDRAQGGLGIGLSLVKSLVEMHGGRVEAHSEGPGRGSEFVVRLPIARPPEFEIRMSDSEVESPSAEAHPQWKRVLVVDDNVDAAKSMALVLQPAGYATRLAHDGATALAAANQFRPDAVLLDIGLPGMDGYEVARRLRASAGGQPLLLVAVTGYGGPDAKRQSTEAGFDHHLVKPVDLDEVQAILRGDAWPEAKHMTGSGEFRPLGSA